MRHHGFVAVALACAAAATGWILSQSDAINASEETASFREVFAKTEASSAPKEDPNGLRINYFDARWDKVLRDVSGHSGLTLVMDRVPPGRFARRDRTRYAPDDCIRILNRELEGLGYRLVRQGQFLIVLRLDNARTRYARPMLNHPADSAHAIDPAAPADQEQPIRTVSRRVERSQVAWAGNALQDDDAQPDDDLPPEPTTIPLRQPRATNNDDDADEQPTEPAGPPVMRSVEVQHGNAAELAKSLYLIFERRAKLVKEGVDGLPTVNVYNTNDPEMTGKPLFRIGIRQMDNTLVVEADASRVDHLVSLVERLDKPRDDGQKTQAIPADNVTDDAAKKLAEQLRKLVAAQAQPNEGAAGEDGPADPDMPDLPPFADASTFNLRGDVNVQAIPELGILLIQGNDSDLERLAPIIERLENMSVGSLPDIHLLELRYVNSKSFAELMTSVYDRLAELRKRGETEQQSIAFFPLVQPNAVLILAPRIELPAILDLADKLDVELDPEFEFQILPLQNAIASQVVTALNSFYEERGGLATRLQAIADVRTNSIIVQGRPNDLKEAATLIKGLDREEPGAVHKVEVIELNHATAAELAEVVSAAIQAVTSPPQQAGGGFGGFGGNQAPQELRDTKSIALEFLATDGDAQELIRSGFLVDVRINADPRSNSVILTAPESTMALMKALIRALDQPPSATAAIKVFALQNADAQQSVELLTTLFENTNQEEQLGVQIAGAEDAASSLIPLTFSADIRTNTVLAVGSEEALSIVEAILLRLDTDDSRERRTEVIFLRNAQAEFVADSINRFLEQQQELQDSTEDLVSNIERLRQEVIVAEDFNSNSLIVSASPEYFSKITEIISELDATPAQIVIQALLVEVTLDNTDEFGVELGFQDPLLFGRSIVADAANNLVTVPTVTNVPGVGQVESTTIVSQSGSPGFNFNNTQQALGNNASGNTGAVGTQGLNNFSLGRQNGDLGFGGFVFSAQSDAVSVLIRALAARRTVHVLSRPQIRATHNNLATIQVGQKVPIVTGENQTVNAITPIIDQEDVGIILEVTPRVTPDGTVVMEVYAEKSALNPSGVPVFSDGATGNVIESPIRDVSIADTTVSVPNGQTIVIGGMITKADQTLERKVPWLGDLPVVGKAFRYDSTNTARTELLIFLTPRIIYGDADAELIKQVEAERLHFIESEAEELHGPIYSVPPGDGLQNGIPEQIYGTPQPDDGYPVLDDFVPDAPAEVPELPEYQTRNAPHTRRPSSDERQSVARAASRNAAGRRSGAGQTDVRPVNSQRRVESGRPVRTAKFEESTAAAPTAAERDEWVRQYLENERRNAIEPAFDDPEDGPFPAPAVDQEFDFSQFESGKTRS